MKCRVLLHLLIAAAAVPSWAADSLCGLDRQLELRGDTRAWRRAALAAGESTDPSCRAAASAALALLEAPPVSACRLLDGYPSDEARLDATLRAALAWRCGRLDVAWQEASAGKGIPLADLVRGSVLAARLRHGRARALLRELVGRAPNSAAALLALAQVEGAREERRSLLERYLEHARNQGEAFERRQGARDNLALIDALDGREVWALEERDLPGEVALRTIRGGPGRTRGWLVAVGLRERRPTPALLDSGASGLHVSEGEARRANFEELTGGMLFGGGGSGRHRISRGLFGELTFGPLRFTSPLAVRAAGALERQGAWRAIIGFDVLISAGADICIDPRTKRLVLSEPAATSGEDLGPLFPSREELPNWAPLHLVSGQLLLPLQVGAPGHRRGALFLLDTGATRSMVAEDLAAQIGGWRRGTSRRARAYGGELPFAGVMPRLRLAGPGFDEVLRDVAVVDLAGRSRITGIRVGGYLGLDLLARQALVIDVARARVAMVGSCPQAPPATAD